MGMNPRLLRPLASGFDPRRIAGLEAWFDASDLSTMAQNSNGTTAATATNDPVGFWRDKSGQGRHAKQTTNNNRPTVQLADRNGRAGLNFDGSNDFFVCDPGAQFGITYFIAVLRRTGTPNAWGNVSGTFTTTNVAGVAASSSLASFGQANVSTGFLYGLVGANASNGVIRRNGTVLPSINSGQFNTWHAEVVPNTTDTNVVVMQAQTTLTTGVNYLMISLDPFAATRVYPMRMYELLAYSSFPTTSQLQAIERYLGGKWGITVV
jgi:hypothetical protein